MSEPSRDGDALQLAIGGDVPYTGVQTYTTLPGVSDAVAFDLELW